MSSRQGGAAAKSPKFDRQGDFRRTLRGKVSEYFEEKGLGERDQRAMYWKSAAMLSWFAISYLVLVFAPVPVVVRVLAAISLGLAGAGIGFSVMHDAGHGAYSSRPWLNKVFFFSLDFLGGSSYLWNVKHNVIHHSYANVDGHDDDIDMGWLGRLAPEQKRLPIHRFQHFYIWFLYGFLVLKWHLYDDFRVLIQGEIGPKRVPKMKRKDLGVFVLGKVLFVTYAFVIPSFFFGLGWILLFYLLATFVQGVTMSLVFQLAHCVEEADFPVPDESNQFGHDWATHQVMTTVDFAPKSKVISWYVGGLNFQIEHHLFPRISHIHYPAIAEIVRETCEEYGLPYRVQPSLWGGVRSHFRWVRQMGQLQTG